MQYKEHSRLKSNALVCEVDDNESTLTELLLQIREWVEKLGWTQYHRPSALAVSAAIEMGELLELFQWRTEEEMAKIIDTPEFHQRLSEEIADVMIYLLRLADVTSINPTEAIREKMKKNEEKYPSDKWHGKRPGRSSSFD
jgi:NTP pyrophosphatase (non-canonical NTP hydrolase)